jgi:hypothetical protein
MTPSQQLNRFIAKFTPDVAKTGRAVLLKMRHRMPGAYEMVYDNYNALVVGFSPTVRPSDAIFSVIFFPRWISVCFIFGAYLDDPGKILQGAGKQVRTLRLAAASDLDVPAVRALIDQALEDAGPSILTKGRRRLEVRAVLKKQRPRRPR